MACVSFVGYGIIQLTVETQKVYLEEKWGSFYTAGKHLMEEMDNRALVVGKKPGHSL